MISDLDNLKIFLQNLPQVDQWDERYIYDLETYDNYEYVKNLAITKKRYVTNNNMAVDGYSLEPFKSSCNLSNDNNESNEQKDEEEEKVNCGSCCIESDEGCTYDDEKCNEFFALSVHNWNELCGYHILFLQGKTPGTPAHPGPWNRETEYIMEPLIKILKQGILTMDSEPGLYIHSDNDNNNNDNNNNNNNNEEFIQKPYLMIGGPAGRIHRILSKILYPEDITLDSTIIKYVNYDLRLINFDGYYNYEQDDHDYVAVMLGIETPKILSKEFLEYIFSNRFFDRILHVVETTP